MLSDFYHVTSKVYDRPTWEGSRDHLYGDGNIKHENGILGLWISPFPIYCMSFGNEVASVKLKDDFKPLAMNLSQLFEFHSVLGKLDSDDCSGRKRDLEIYTALREKLLPLGDVLFIKDASECFGEIVVLNYDAIDKFEYVDPQKKSKH